MKEPDWSDCTEEEIWKFVAWYLARHGIETFLVGGAVAAIYSEGAYQSGDLDFVLRTSLEKKVPEVMAKIGFIRQKSQHFVRPDCAKFIEFVNGPVGIGDDVRITPAEVKVGGETLYIYTPTDCIRDRLASFIHFRARECLDQAVLVARKFPFDQKKVKKWCLEEGAPEAFDELMRQLRK